MKKLITLVTVLTMVLSMGVSVNAAKEPADTEFKPPQAEVKANGERPDLTTLFTTYYPEGLETFLDLQSEHQAFHDSQAAKRETMHEEVLAERKALRASIEAGEITPEEAKIMMAEKRETISAMREALEAIRLEKQSEGDAIKSEKEASLLSLKAALTAKVIDETTVAGILEDLSNQLRAHIDMDYAYADLIEAVIAEYK